MIDRSRLAVAGASLALVSVLVYLGLTWSGYQDDLASQANDFAWEPTYWRFIRNGFTFSAQLLIVAGIVMVIIAAAMRPARDDDSMFRA